MNNSSIGGSFVASATYHYRLFSQNAACNSIHREQAQEPLVHSNVMESDEANNPPYEPIETLKDWAILGHEVASTILDRISRFPVESSLF